MTGKKCGEAPEPKKGLLPWEKNPAIFNLEGRKAAWFDAAFASPDVDSLFNPDSRLQCSLALHFRRLRFNLSWVSDGDDWLALVWERLLTWARSAASAKKKKKKLRARHFLSCHEHGRAQPVVHGTSTCNATCGPSMHMEPILNGGYSQNGAGRGLRGTFAHGSMLDVWLVAWGREKLAFESYFLLLLLEYA